MQTSDSLSGEAAAYLAKLNDAQRRAAVFSGAERALLVIAGAGSGKTNTLAHRVAHLIVTGADPRRILLMTFSRRASAEMVSRVRRICKEALGARADVLADALTWAGTFHSIGARLLREQALNIGLDPDFTIHDREDSADLLNLARHDLGLSKTEKRFPTKGTCLAIYSRAVNSEAPLEEVLGKHFPWCAGWADELKRLFAAYVEAKQAQNVLDYDDLLLYWAQMMQEPALAEEISARYDHVLVDEYQDTNRLQASILFGLKPDGRGLTAVGDDAQSIYAFRAAEVRNILDFPAKFTPPAEVVTLERNYRSTQTILEAANGVIALAKERFSKNLWTSRQTPERPALVVVRDETDQANFVAEKILEARETGMRLKDQAVLFRAAHHSGPLEIELTRRNIPFVKFGGLKFLDSAHVKDILAFLRFCQNPRDRISGFRLLQLLPGVGPAAARKILDRIAPEPAPLQTLAGLPAPAKTGEHWGALVDALRAPSSWPRRSGAGEKLVRAASRPVARGFCHAEDRPRATGGDRAKLSVARKIPHRTHARPTRRHQRRGRSAIARRGLSHSLHHPFRQGPGVEKRVRSQCGGRLHPLRPRHRDQRGDRGGAPAALCRHDPRQGPFAADHAAKIFHPRPAQPGRPPRLCRAQPLYPDRNSGTFRHHRLAGGPRRREGAGLSNPREPRRAHARHVEMTAPERPTSSPDEAMRSRKIIHIDMDAFYASVEQRDNPELRGKPVAVGHGRARGVVAAASYEARAFGVHSAMPSVTAQRKCPELIFTPPRFDVYRAVSLQIREIFARHTPLIEPLVAGRSLSRSHRHSCRARRSATQVAEKIRAAIFAETGLTASAGVSYNKFLAKMASDQRKPNGLFVITPKQGPPSSAALPVRKFHGVGPATADKMKRLGIETGEDLRACAPEFLTEHFGKAGAFYAAIARGEDHRPVKPNRERKSIGAENTFLEDIFAPEAMREKIAPIVTKVFAACERLQMFGRTVTIKVKYADFRQITRAQTESAPVASSDDLSRRALNLLKPLFPSQKGVRLLGVTVSGFDEPQKQADQFDFSFRAD